MARRSGGLIVPRQTMVRYVYERPGDTFVRPVEVVPDSDDDLSAGNHLFSVCRSIADSHYAFDM